MSGAPAPGRRRPLLLWVSLGLVAAFLLCSAPIAVGVAVFRATDRDGFGVDAAATPSGPAPSPTAGDDQRITQAWLAERIQEALDKQAAALLAGDEAGFVGVADPVGATGATLKRQFATLRAMKVTRWEPDVTTLPAKHGGGQWRVLVEVEHCFVLPGCERAPVTYGTRWSESPAGLRMVAVEPSMSTSDGPRPWEVDALAVAVGKRTLVATSGSLRKQLPQVLAEAEEAAVIADRYAVGGAPPPLYRIFYAGEKEWTSWYGGGRPAWTAGYALPIGNGQIDVVINAAAPHRTQLDDLLRHEMTHAASMPGQGFQSSAWWLMEGIAELAAAGGIPLASYEGREDVRRLVRERNWNGPLQELRIADGAPDWEVSASYGVGYIAVRTLAERFGEPEVLRFLQLVAHDNRPIDEASREVFGEPWQTLNDQCVAAVRALAG